MTFLLKRINVTTFGLNDEFVGAERADYQIRRKIMDYLEYKGYKGSVEYSKEDNCLFGKVQGMSMDLIVYEGQTLDELRKDFEDGINDFINRAIKNELKKAATL